jgi:hypothetical protein
MSEQRSTRRSGRSSLPGEKIVAAIILGVFLLIAANAVGKMLDVLSKTVKETTFSDTNSFASPSELTYIDKKYMNVDEAASYLRMSPAEITDLIKSGEISEYVSSDSGYIISVTVLDAWFENEAYQNKIGANSDEN